jgi:transketolase
MEKNIKSTEIRKKIVELVYKTNEGHIASSFSIVEILVAIFESQKNDIKTQNIILSKGHAAFAYYAALKVYGLMSEQEFNSICRLGSKYHGHIPRINNDQRFSFGTGSLGHGLPYSVGLAYAKKDQKIICIIGDGEANEGTFWESLLIINKFNLKNIQVIIDCNQSSERAIPIDEIIKSINILPKIMCDGHNLNSIENCLKSDAVLIIANTTKGYPVSIMQNNPIWHHKKINEYEYAEILKEI